MKAPRLFAYCQLCDVSESLMTLMTLSLMTGWLMMSGTLSTTTYHGSVEAQCLRLVNTYLADKSVDTHQQVLLAII